jgi:hypothetical protein
MPDSDFIVGFDPAPINMGYILLNIHNIKIYDWGIFSIKDSTNEGSCKKLAQNLDELKLTDDINSIVLHEQQPRCNIKTIVISGQLQMYHVLKKMNKNNSTAKTNIEKIVGYHAKNKLTYYQEMPGDEPMPWDRLNKLKKGHYRNKQIGIEQCRRVLKQNNDLEWLEWFEAQSKKDDIADTLLTVLSYIKTNKLGKFKKT